MNTAYELKSRCIHISEEFKTIFQKTSAFFKSILVPNCEVHKYINFQVLEILKNDNFFKPYRLFKKNIEQINNGVVWADKYFKNIQHFYNPYTKKGLIWKKHALCLANKYYNQALINWHQGDIANSMFYLGSSIHLVQDMFVPQHASVKILDNHKKYENFVKNSYPNISGFSASEGGYYDIYCIEDAIVYSAKYSIRIYSKLSSISDINKKFFSITRFIFPRVQRTTAGCFMMFYNDINTTETTYCT